MFAYKRNSLFSARIVLQIATVGLITLSQIKSRFTPLTVGYIFLFCCPSPDSDPVKCLDRLLVKRLPIMPLNDYKIYEILPRVLL
jgi:hypothetical protein